MAQVRPEVLDVFQANRQPQGRGDRLRFVCHRLVLDHVVGLPEVAHAGTSLIFEHVRGEAPLA